jgi:hypothetical protein
VSLAVIGLLSGLLSGSAQAWGPQPNSVSGEAFGVSVKVSVSGAEVTVGPTPHVVLCPDGGMAADQVLRVSVPNTAVSDTLSVSTTGAIGPNRASAQSKATVEHVNVLNGLVTAELVVAMSSSTADGSTATSTAEGSTLLGLSINGSAPVDVTPAPNTTISILGVGTVILNEQLPGGDGVHTSALTVNMIHVIVNDPLKAATGDVIVSSAHSDVNFAPAPKVGQAFMTGGGKLGTGRDIATFGLHAGERGGVLHGQLQLIDHGQDLNVHSTLISSFTPPDPGGACVAFSGKARVNNVDGYAFKVNQACDKGEPGIGVDSLDVSVWEPGGRLILWRSERLTGGNLQLHPE